MASAVFYATNADYRRLGSPIYKTHKLSESEAAQMRDFIKFMEDGKPIQTGILFTLIGAGIARTVASIGYSLITSTTISIAASYFGIGYNFSKKFADMVDSAQNCFNVEFEYTYRRKDGKEGAYWLTDVKILD